MNKLTKLLLGIALPLAAFADPVTSDEAACAVGTWIGLKPQLGCRLGSSVAGARTCVPTNGVTFHVVKLAGGGFVVTSSDTEIEPILAFSESDDLVESERNPLWTLLRRDLAQRAGRRRQLQTATAGATPSVRSTAGAKWARLLPKKATNGVARALQAATGTTELSDLRVAPLLETKWNQELDDDSSAKGNPCYNYYTPNNCPCGCVATAGAQIMRYHLFPSDTVTPGSYACSVSGEPRDLTMRGGVYNWSAMPAVPAVGTTAAQRQAIGKLTSDVGISCLMDYGPNGSSSPGCILARRLLDRFGYASAVAACGESLDMGIVRTALVSNLDAKLPVMLGIDGTDGGHAVVADGYGYSLETFYAHVNMGWGGENDAWYAPPDIGEGFSSVDLVVYNVYPADYADVIHSASAVIGGVPTNGVICSGRVMSSSGKPICGAAVLANGTHLTSTDEKGIYSFILSPGEYKISCEDSSRTATLKANVGSEVNDDGSYMTLPKPEVNNVILDDLTVEDGSAFVWHTVVFDLGTHGSRTGGGRLTQSVTDGSSAKAPEFTVADGWTFTGWSQGFTNVTSDLIVRAQYKESGGGGGDTPTSTVKPGVWTTDVEGVRSAKDCRMVVILSAIYDGCWWSQHEQAVFENSEFLAWAAEKGIYLVSTDPTHLPEGCSNCVDAAQWSLALKSGLTRAGVLVDNPNIVIVGPGDLDRPIAIDVVRSGETKVGGVYYDGTYCTLAEGLQNYLYLLEKMASTLTGVTIEGPESVVSEGSATYSCSTRFADGSEYLVDPKWKIASGSDYSSISSNGEFTATLPAGTCQPLTSVIKATCTVGDVTKTASFPVTVNPIVTKVSFDANGGTGAGSAVTVAYGAAMPPVATMPVRRGYTFLGYYDAAEGGTRYYTETLAGAGTWDKKDATTVLYAHWECKYGPSPWWPDPLTDEDWLYADAVGGVAITGVSQTDGVLLLPETVTNRPVVALAAGALANKGLSVVIVPAAIAAIGTNAFSNDTALARIDFEGLPPDGLASAGIPTNALVRYNDAFAEEWRSVLTNGVLADLRGCGYRPQTGIDWVCERCDDGVRIVDVRSGGETGRVDVRLPQVCEGLVVRGIGANAFDALPGLSSVVVPASVTDVARGAFALNPDLESIDVIGANPCYASVGGVLYDKTAETLLRCPRAAAAVQIPSTVRRIAAAAFVLCRRLESLRIPAAVTQIDVPVLVGCEALTNLTVDAKNRSYCVRDGMLFDAARSTLLGCLFSCRQATLPQTVRRIAGCGFCCCTNLTDVVLPAGLCEIGDEAFEECLSLASIEIPSGVREIPDSAFRLCGNLSSVAFLGAVSSIGAGSFASCANLAELTLPASVSDIGADAFAGCPDLELTFEGAPPVCGRDAVRSCKRGYYAGARAAWRRAVDGAGRWNGLAMEDRCSLVAFESSMASAAVGGSLVFVVQGGNACEASRVTVAVSYVNAKAANLLLKGATVAGADGIEQTGLAFPLTLRWQPGDTEPKTVSIPVAVGKAADAPKYLIWNLTDPKALELGETVCCIGRIAGGGEWDGKDVCVLPYVADVAGGKVSGGTSVRPGAKGVFRTVTLKATANKGYWFAGWYDEDGEWVGGNLSLKVLPVAGNELMRYEAMFVPAMTELAATYTGFATVNLKGMALVKGADTSVDVLGDCPMTVSLATSGKLSGAITVGGKKVSFAVDGCCLQAESSGAAKASGEVRARFKCPLNERAWFGKTNDETLELEISRQIMDGEPVEYGIARSVGASGCDAYAPLGDGTNAVARRATDKADLSRLAPFVGNYAVAFAAEGGVIPLSVSVDNSGRVKATGRSADGTALAMSGTLSCGSATASLFATPKALGSGSLHVELPFVLSPAGGATLANAWCTLTRYTAATVAVARASAAFGCPYEVGCWHPAGIDPEVCVVRLASDGETVDICYAAKNGAITGLATPTATGETVKFDAKTGLLVVTKGRAYTIQGVLGDYGSGCHAAGRIDADGTCRPVIVTFVKLPTPVEDIPWTDSAFSISLGQKVCEGAQPSVTVDGQTLPLTITGLPTGLKFDKATGRITGVPTRAGSSTVKVSYRYGSQTITRTTTFVVGPKPEDLPSGSYAGLVTVRYREGRPDARLLYCPIAVTVGKTGALSGSVTVAGRKRMISAAGYDACSAGFSLYDNVALDLSDLDDAWDEVSLELSVSNVDLIGENAPVATDGLNADIKGWICGSRFWIDDSIDPDDTCLEMTCDNQAFDAAKFGWTTRTIAGEKRISGVGKTINKSKVTFKIEDKTGLFTGKSGTSKIYGSMEKGTCTGVGMIVGLDGSIGTVFVEPVER